VNAIEPMVIKEDIELEKALDVAFKSSSSSTQGVDTSMHGSQVGSESQKQNQSHQLLELAKIIARGFANKRKFKGPARTKMRQALKSYTSLTEWELEVASKGSSLDEAA